MSKARSKTSPVQFDVGFTVNRQGKPALDCQFTIPRLLGTSAAIAADASISSFVAHSFNVKYTIPDVVGGWLFSAEAVKQVNDFQYSSSHSESATGFGLGFSKGNHRVGLDAYLRDIHPLVSLAGTRFTASEQIRRVPLRTIKTAVNYKYTVDRVVRTPHPVHGHRLSVNADIAGLFGDVRLTKLESAFSMHRRLFKGLVWHSRIGAGAIALLNPSRQQSPIQDRFFLGGTNEEFSALRGFGYRSVGPCGKRVVMAGTNVKKGDRLYDHLGGDAYVSLDNVVSFPLYVKDGIDIRGIVFGQIGSLIPTLHSKAISELSRNVRASVGAGFVVPVGNFGTVEITVGTPLHGVLVSDSLQMLQVGIRVGNVKM